MNSTSEGLRLRLGPFAGAAVRNRAVHRVVSGLVDEITTHESGQDVWVDMRVTREPLPLTG